MNAMGIRCGVGIKRSGPIYIIFIRDVEFVEIFVFVMFTDNRTLLWHVMSIVIIHKFEPMWVRHQKKWPDLSHLHKRYRVGRKNGICENWRYSDSCFTFLTLREEVPERVSCYCELSHLRPDKNMAYSLNEFWYFLPSLWDIKFLFIFSIFTLNVDKILRYAKFWPDPILLSRIIVHNIQPNKQMFIFP